MSSLRFTYAAPRPSHLTATVTRVVPSSNWKVSSSKLDAINQISDAPDFMWVDLGKAPNIESAELIILKLAAWEEKAAISPFYFITGSSLKEADHLTLLTHIYTHIPRPSDVVTDLLGNPDLWSALAKFTAQRKAEAASVTLRAPVVAPVPNADLRAASGRLSIKLIARVFGLTVAEVGRLIGRKSKAALSKTPDAASLQDLLRPLADIALLRAAGLGDEDFRKWLNTANDDLGKESPLALIRAGHLQDVAGFVYGALTGQPA